MLTRICSIDGCTAKYQAKGLCHTHYERVRRTGSVGSPDTSRQPATRCSVADCDRRVIAQGLCQRHVRRLRKSGDALYVPPPLSGAESPRWKGDEIGYIMAHQRVTKLRGPAREHYCTDCGGRARQWSYTHRDPDQKRHPNGYPYSLDPAFYVPRCYPCHSRFDRDAERIA